MKTRRIIRIIISILILTAVILQAGAAQAQPPIQLASVQVGLFPEYDRSEMLIVLDIELSEETSDPRTLIFQVPADAAFLRVSLRVPDEDPAPLSYEILETGEWKDVRFSTDSSAVQIEYYDPNLGKEDDRRFYQYQWLSYYPVESLTLTVRQPFGAGEIQTDPPLSDREIGPDNTSYYSQAMGSIPAGESFALNLIYTKDPSNLAYPAFKVEPAVPVSEATSGRTPSPLSVIMWLFTVAVAVLLLVGLYYYWFKANMMENRDGMVQGVGIMNPEKQAVYCHECGMRSRPADSYCSNCGTELRRPSQNTLHTNS